MADRFIGVMWLSFFVKHGTLMRRWSFPAAQSLFLEAEFLLGFAEAARCHCG